MPPTQAGAAVPFPNAFPILFIANNVIAAGIHGAYTNNTLGTMPVLTGLDGVASNANPIQCFFWAQSTGSPNVPCQFYYDSQSTGEGNGVWFSWRGALPMPFGTELELFGNSSGTSNWSVTAWGCVIPLSF